MSKNAAMDFINELRTNVELYDHSLKIDTVDEMVEIAQKSGYTVTAEDLVEAETEARRLLSDESDKAVNLVTEETCVSNYYCNANNKKPTECHGPYLHI